MSMLERREALKKENKKSVVLVQEEDSIVAYDEDASTVLEQYRPILAKPKKGTKKDGDKEIPYVSVPSRWLMDLLNALWASGMPCIVIKK
jgi:hypothetical protein